MISADEVTHPEASLWHLERVTQAEMVRDLATALGVPEAVALPDAWSWLIVTVRDLRQDRVREIARKAGCSEPAPRGEDFHRRDEYRAVAVGFTTAEPA